MIQKKINPITGKVTWIARIYIGNIDGTKREESKSFERRKEAEEYYRQIKDFNSNSPNRAISSKVIFNEVARSYFESKELTLKDNTIRSYRSKFNVWISPDLGNIQVGDIDNMMLNRFFLKIKNRGEKSASPGTVYHVSVVLYEIFEFASNSIEGYIKTNPMKTMQRFTKEEKGPELDAYWSVKDTNKFLLEAKKTPYFNMFVFMLNTGLRIAETAAIQESSLDLEGEILKVTYQLNKHEARHGEQKFTEPAYFLDAPKSKRTRTVPLNKFVIDILKEEINKSHDKFIFAPGKTEPKIFITKRGPKAQFALTRYVTTRTVSYVMERICKSAGVNFIGPHGLRHTYSASFLMNGGDIYTLSKLLGHKSVNTTIANYGHLSDEFLKNASKGVVFGKGI